MQLETSKNPIVKLVNTNQDENVYEIKHHDLLWLLECTRAVLQNDLKNIEGGFVADHIRQNIERLEDCLEYLDVNDQ
jgi:hypothetical protein